MTPEELITVDALTHRGPLTDEELDAADSLEFMRTPKRQKK